MSIPTAYFGKSKSTFSKPEVRRQHLGQALDGGLHFNGSGDVTATALTLPAPYSFEVILKTGDDVTTGQILIGNASASSARRALELNSGEIRFSYYNGSSWVSVSGGSISTNTIYHIVATRDFSDVQKIYINGLNVTTGTNAVSTFGTSGLSLGYSSNAGYPHRLKGTLSRARIYNRVIDAPTVFEQSDIAGSEQWGSTTSLVDAAASTFEGTSTYSFNPYGNNTTANVGNELVVTYVDNSQGFYTYLKDSYRLTTDLTVGKKYRLKIDAKYAGGSAGVKLRIANGVLTKEFATLTTSMTSYEVEFIAHSADGCYINLGDMSASNVVTLDNWYLYPCGVLSSFELQTANPSQSLMVQDRSGAADATCSASGITQINGITQLNSTSARIGSTGGPETPADGELIASKVNVTTSGNGEVIVSRDSGASVLTQAQASAGRIGTSSNHELQFTANNTVYARIKNNGLFGVNQGDPVQQMQVTGDGSGSTAVDSHGYGLRVSDSNHAHGAVDIVSSADTAQFIARSNVQGGFSFKSYASVGTSLVERVKIDASGNVYVASGKFGVGNAATSTPSHLLTVQDSGATGLAKIYSTTGTVTDGQKIVEIRADDAANPVGYDLLNVAQGDKERLVVTGEGDTTLKRWTAGNGTGANTVLTLAVDDLPAGTDMAAGDGTRLLFKIPAADVSKVGASIDAVRAQATDADSSTNLRFMVSQNDETLDTAMTIDSAGSIGVATTPKACENIFVPVQVGSAASLVGRTAANQCRLGNNIYFHATGAVKRINAGYASQYVQNESGTHSFQYAGTAAADSAVTFSEAMKINDSGQVTVGVDADPSQTASPSMLITKATAPSDVNGYSQLVLQRTDGHHDADGAQIMFNQGYHSGNTDYPAPVAAIRAYRTGPADGYGGGLKLCYQPNNAALGVAQGLTISGSGHKTFKAESGYGYIETHDGSTLSGYIGSGNSLIGGTNHTASVADDLAIRAAAGGKIFFATNNNLNATCLTLHENSNAFFNGNIGVGAGADIGGSGVAAFAPSEKINVRGAGAESPQVLLESYSATSSRCASIAFKKSHTNTGGANEATLDTENLGKILWKGISSGDGVRDSAEISAVCHGAPDGSDQPAKLVFKTSATDETLGERMIINRNGIIEAYGHSGGYASIRGENSITLANDGTTEFEAYGSVFAIYQTDGQGALFFNEYQSATVEKLAGSTQFVAGTASGNIRVWTAANDATVNVRNYSGSNATIKIITFGM